MIRNPRSTLGKLPSDAPRRPPSGPPGFMFRPVRTRLLAELEEYAAQRPKILSLIAPIGYGKTVLMSELFRSLQQQGEHCLWIALDEREIRVEHLIRLVEAALPGNPPETQPGTGLLSGDEPLALRIDELLEHLARLAAPATLFIDNLNSCTDPALGQLLDALSFATPQTLRLVWSSTNTLPLNLGRAKLEGLIRQIGYADLSLAAGEVRELLGSELDSVLGPRGIDTVLRHTEGWPAAIRLAQIVLSDADQPLAALQAFSGSDEDLAALLNRQVLEGFPEDLRDFLLSVSLLNTFDSELCRQATGSAQVDRHLELLLHRNVFIIPLDRNRIRYRLHGLFRQFLLSEARRRLSDARRREVLQRAAECCEQRGEWKEAIEYALSAGEQSLAQRLLDRTGTLFVRDHGDIPQYIQWVERLLGESGKIGWEAHFWYIWALIFHRRYEFGLIQLEKLADRYARYSPPGDAPPNDLPQRIDYLHICLDLFMDRIEMAYRRADRWVPPERSDDPYNTGSVTGLKGVCLSSMFRLPQARQAIRIAEQILLQVGGAYTIGWLSLGFACVSLYEGDYSSAYKELLSGLSRIRGSLGEDAVLCDMIAFVAAQCAVEMGLDDEAPALLERGLRSAHTNGLVDTTACGFAAAVKLWTGKDDDLVSLDRLREIAGGYPPRLSAMLSCYLIQRLLCLGRPDDAQAEAERIGLTLDGAQAPSHREELASPRYRDLFMATRVDLLIARGRFRPAETLIEQEMRLARDEGRVARLVELGLAQVTLGVRTDNQRLATKALSLAIGRATRRQILRPFLDRADSIAALVNETRPSAWSFALAEEREFFTALCRQLPISSAPLHDWTARQAMDSPALVMPTGREVELLGLLDTGLDNQRIAEHMDVSINTLKWHLKNLYRKLGVTRRPAAISRARALGLLSR